ncbi:hypothetical protein N0V83_008263 [Neocucurbitaria cava]|uniref:Uncharacterized protein n=1 Tax=Neocucurbitaria cava TaxID=798079 RepID=A0A9W8Y2A9_9PLEO|nr:hypothetical protein N0V83_008263 [Neocucurbitaria cava]
MSVYAIPAAIDDKLRKPSDWPKWYNRLKYHAMSTGVWKQIDPDNNVQFHVYKAQPVGPELREITTEAPAPHTAAEIQLFGIHFAKWEVEMSNWEFLAERYENVQNWVYATVDPKILGRAKMAILISTTTSVTLQNLIKQLRYQMDPRGLTTNRVRGQVLP